MTSDIRKLCCAIALLALFPTLSTTVCAASEHGFAALPGSIQHTTDKVTSKFTNPHMSVVVVLAPRDASGLSSLLADLYNTNNQISALAGQGRVLLPFCPGPSAGRRGCRLSARERIGRGANFVPLPAARRLAQQHYGKAFKTALHTYRNRNGVTYFSNASEIQLPKAWPPEFWVLWVFRIPCACNRRLCVPQNIQLLRFQAVRRPM